MNCKPGDLAVLDTERREALRADDARIIGGQGYRWPEVDKHTHPAKHRRPLVERREGPRSDSYFTRLAEQ